MKPNNTKIFYKLEKNYGQYPHALLQDRINPTISYNQSMRNYNNIWCQRFLYVLLFNSFDSYLNISQRQV